MTPSAVELSRRSRERLASIVPRASQDRPAEDAGIAVRRAGPALDEAGERHAERIGDPGQRLERRIALPSLDQAENADARSRSARQLGERVSPGSRVPDGGADRGAEAGRRGAFNQRRVSLGIHRWGSWLRTFARLDGTPTRETRASTEHSESNEPPKHCVLRHCIERRAPTIVRVTGSQAAPSAVIDLGPRGGEPDRQRAGGPFDPIPRTSIRSLTRRIAHGRDC